MSKNWLAKRNIVRRWRDRLGLGLLLCMILAVLTSCQAQVSTEQLDQWHKEAIAENSRLTELHSSTITDNWILRVQGQVKTPITLNWSEIEALSDTTINSINPHPGNPDTPHEFRGISVEKLLNQAIVDPAATEVTVVAADSYYATIPLADLYRNKGLLAIAEYGKPIRRNEGGPIHLVFLRDANTTQADINTQRWTYYVTHVIVGTEPLSLKVGKNTLTAADLEKLPTYEMTSLVGYKIGWADEPVKLIGVNLRDILRSQNVVMPPQSFLRVRRKSMDDLDPQKSVRIPASLINTCDVMLAYRWGENNEAIPASKGGAITLAYGNNCPSESVKNLAWLPFVESLSVESAEMNL